MSINKISDLLRAWYKGIVGDSPIRDSLIYTEAPNFMGLRAIVTNEPVRLTVPIVTDELTYEAYQILMSQRNMVSREMFQNMMEASNRRMYGGEHDGGDQYGFQSVQPETEQERYTRELEAKATRGMDHARTYQSGQFMYGHSSMYGLAPIKNFKGIITNISE